MKTLPSDLTRLFLASGLSVLAWGDLCAATDKEPPVETIRAAVVPSTAKDAANEEVTDAPVPVPPLSHYAALWQRSMFTTHDMPAPEVPQGPGFADQLALAGIYEVDGAVIAVILDKMTAQVMEAKIGSDNEQGIRIKSVNAGETSAATRVQLQKGMQSGWVGFADAAPEPAPPPSPELASRGQGTRAPLRESAPIPQEAPIDEPDSTAQLLPPGLDPTLATPASDDLPLPPE